MFGEGQRPPGTPPRKRLCNLAGTGWHELDGFTLRSYGYPHFLDKEAGAPTGATAPGTCTADTVDANETHGWKGGVCNSTTPQEGDPELRDLREMTQEEVEDVEDHQSWVPTDLTTNEEGSWDRRSSPNEQLVMARVPIDYANIPVTIGKRKPNFDAYSPLTQSPAKKKWKPFDVHDFFDRPDRPRFEFDFEEGTMCLLGPSGNPYKYIFDCASRQFVSEYSYWKAKDHDQTYNK